MACTETPGLHNDGCDCPPDMHHYAPAERNAIVHAANRLRIAAERGYRTNTARYTHYREAADLMERCANG